MTTAHENQKGRRHRRRWILGLACVAVLLAAAALLLGPPWSQGPGGAKLDELGRSPSARLPRPARSEASPQPALVPQRRVRGRVVDPSGDGVAGASVCASEAGVHAANFTRYDDRCTRSGAHGSFSLQLPVDQTARLGALAPGWVPMRPEPLLVPAHTAPEIEIVMVRGGRRIHGTVRDRLGGVIEGVAVRANGAVPYPAAVTDAQGHYTLWVDPGVSFLWTSHDGYAPGMRTLSGVGWDATIDFELAPQAVIRGRVLDEAREQPVAGVRVYWSPPGDLQYGASLGPFAVSDDLGNFELRGILPGRRYRPTVIDTRWYGSTPSPVLAALGEEREVVVPVRPAFALDGSVVRDDGSPCPKGRAEAWLDGAGVMVGATGSAGSVQLPGLAPGSYQIKVSCDGFQGRTHAVQISPGNAPTPQVWPVGRRNPGEVNGRVLTPTGAPRPGARVTLWQPGGEAPRRTTADQEGRFELAGLRLGSFTVEARLAGGAASVTRRAELQEEETSVEVELILPDTGSVEVSVLDRTGEPARGAFPILLHDELEDAPRFHRAYRTDDAGRVRIEGVPEGPLTVALMPPGSPRSTTLDEPPLQSENVQVTGERPVHVEFHVQGEFGDVRGRFLHADGTAVVGAQVTAHRGQLARAFGGRQIHPTLGRAWTDGDGEFVLSRLPADVPIILRGHLHGRVIAEERAATGDRVSLREPPSTGSE